MRVRVLVLSQYRVLDEGLRAVLGEERDIEVVGVCRDSAKVYHQASILAPDVLLVVSGGESVVDSAFPVLEDIVTRLVCVRLAAGDLQVYHRHSIGRCDLREIVAAVRDT